MTTYRLPKLLLTAMLALAPTLPIIGYAPLAQASALPPGVNPSTPAGGNGGDAQGYEKKPIAPVPSGTRKPAADAKKTVQPSSSPSVPTQKKPKTHKKMETNKP